MPTRPPPCKYQCPSCHWKKTVAPRSDAVILGYDCFDKCPQCGHAPLAMTMLPRTPDGPASILQVLERWLKP